MKFGGTSLKTEDRIQNAAQIVIKAKHPVVITSAMSQVTNTLISTAEAALSGKTKEVIKNLEWIRDKHFSVAKSSTIRNEIETLLNELEKLYHGISMIGELSPRSLDLVSSFGERLSSWLMVETLENLDQKAQRVDSRELIITDEQFGKAEILWDKTCKNIQKTVAPLIKKGIIPVITGYISATIDGQTTTLGRGGSDYSAAIVGVCLNASEIQIWTDVDGMMTSDPRLVKNARPIPKISFQEASELAHFGARVLHPKTIQPAVDANVSVRILNTLNPEAPGTLIVKENAANMSRSHSIKAIAFKKKISVINICSSRMLGPYGFLAELFQVFATHEVSVDVLATSEVSVSITVEDDSFDDSLIKDLSKIGNATVTPNQTLICVVGNGLKNDYHVDQKVFEILAKEKIATELTSKGASQINLTFIVSNEHADKAIQSLQHAFFA